MKIINEDITYTTKGNKIIMDRDVYTELLYRINKTENEHMQKVYFLQEKIIHLNDKTIELKTKINEILSLILENKEYWEEMHYDGCGVDDAIDKIIDIIISR